MKFALVFDQSGDELEFEAINPDVVEYYVSCVKQAGAEKFCIENHATADLISQSVVKLDQLIRECNTWLGPLFDCELIPYDFEQYFDQNILNRVHAQWVNTHRKNLNLDAKRVTSNNDLIAQLHDQYPDHDRFPKLGDVVVKIGKAREFNLINDMVHRVEVAFSNLKFACSQTWLEFDNIFDPTKITLDVCNLYLPFNHLGRNQYNKFVWLDHNNEYDDENTFRQLLKYVQLRLDLPQTIPYSPQYQDWCDRHQRPLTGDLIPLGNIPNFHDNLKKYRIIVLRNLQAKNTFSFHI